MDRRGRVSPYTLFLAPQRREQNHIPNAWAVGEQHHQTVNANAAAAGRRHAVFQRTNVVGIKIHGLFVARIFGGDLRMKPSCLVFGVVELGKAVGDLAARDEQFKAFRDLGPGIGRPGQGGDLDRVGQSGFPLRPAY